MSNKILEKDTTIKILSVVFAVLLWFYVITEQNPIIPKDIFDIPVDLINKDYLDRNNLILTSDMESFKINVSLKGKKSAVDTITKTSLKVTADLSSIKAEGESQIPINISGFPEGVTWRTSVNIIKVSVEPKISAQHAINVKLTGNPSLGLAPMTAIIDPADVIVTGAASVVSKVFEARVDVDVAGSNSDVSKNLSVRLFDKEGNEVTNVDYQPKRVNVQVPIANTKRVAIQYDIEGLPAVGFVVTNTYLYPREILITGKPEALNSIEFINTEKININNMTLSLDREVGLIMPLDIELVNKADRVRINVDIEEIITRSISIADVELRNLPEGYINDPVSEPIMLTVSGPKSLVNNAKNTVKLYVDMRNAEEGENTVDIMWEKDMDLSIIEVNPQSLIINVNKAAAQNSHQ